MTSAPARQAATGPGVWRSGDLGDAECILTLDRAQRSALVAAATRASEVGATAETLAEAGGAAGEVPAELAALHARLAAMVCAGHGFVLVREFPVDLLDESQVALAFVLLGLGLGRPVRQNALGETLTHIRDERLAADGRPIRRYRTSLRQDFHSDGADVIGLLCLCNARRGGTSRIVSSLAIYNELLARRPDLVDVLYEPMYWDRQGEAAPGERPWFVASPLRDIDGEPRLFYIGWYLRDAQQHSDVPRLTGTQIEAMEHVEAIANDPAFHLAMEFRPGDVQFLDNARILHARDAYEDHEDLAARRHLLRLWLSRAR